MDCVFDGLCFVVGGEDNVYFDVGCGCGGWVLFCWVIYCCCMVVICV